jgi:hypothetical protein
MPPSAAVVIVRFPSDAHFRYAAAVSEAEQPLDLDEVVKVLVLLGTDQGLALDQLHDAPDAALPGEIAALTVESEAGLLMPRDVEAGTALFDLVDGLRQAGVVASLGQTADGPALVLGDPTTATPEASGVRVYEARLDAAADATAIVHALSQLLPETHQILIATDYDAGEALALALLDRGSYAWLRAALGAARTDAVLRPAVGASPGVVLVPVPVSALTSPDFEQRYSWHLPEAASEASVENVFARVRDCDPRVAWPDGRKRPPGDDFYELSCALAGEPLQRCIASGGPREWANLLYRFALVTTVGSHWDVIAARLNPGMSAQGVLGLGQLNWSWFIFEALGARHEAQRAGALLDTDWVRNQERGMLAARQRAWFDLGTLLRHGKRRPAVRRLLELLPLLERTGWQSPARVQAALAVHTEPEGDQLTHQPLYHLWPAPLYALARRAGALDLLPARDAFLGRPLHVADVDMSDPMVARLKEQLARIDAMDETRLPPLLDPLPVIVDVRITEVDAKEAHGRTLLASRPDAEHHVVAPHGGRAMQPGEIWLMEVLGARPARARARLADLGEVAYNISLPTGEWLSRAESR